MVCTAYYDHWPWPLIHIYSKIKTDIRIWHKDTYTRFVYIYAACMYKSFKKYIYNISLYIYIYIYIYNCKTNNDITHTNTSLNIKKDFYSLRQNKMNSSRCIPLNRQNFKLKTTRTGAPNVCTLTHNHVQIIQTFLRSHSPSLTSHSPSCFRTELQLWSQLLSLMDKRGLWHLIIKKEENWD